MLLAISLLNTLTSASARRETRSTASGSSCSRKGSPFRLSCQPPGGAPRAHGLFHAWIRRCRATTSPVTHRQVGALRRHYFTGSTDQVEMPSRCRDRCSDYFPCYL